MAVEVTMEPEIYAAIVGLAEACGLSVPCLCARALPVFRFVREHEDDDQRLPLVTVPLSTKELAGLRDRARSLGVPVIELLARSRDLYLVRDHRPCVVVVRDPATDKVTFLGYPPVLDIGEAGSSGDESSIWVSAPHVVDGTNERVEVMVSMPQETHQALRSLTSRYGVDTASLLGQAVAMYGFLLVPATETEQRHQ